MVITPTPRIQVKQISSIISENDEGKDEKKDSQTG
jgi:hypothetical protein